MFLLHPLLYIITAASLIHFLGGRRKRWLWLIFAVGVYVVSLPFIPQALVRSLEFKYAPIPEVDRAGAYHILVLGAGKNDDERLCCNQRLEAVPLARVVEGVKWYHRLDSALLIGSGPLGRGRMTQADLMNATAEVLGVPSHHTATQPHVKNTRTEALAYVQQFGTHTPLILCTSAIHMPRAVAWFKAHGVMEIIPAPAHYLAPREQQYTWRSLLPSINNLNLWQAWGKETVGRWLVSDTVS